MRTQLLALLAVVAVGGCRPPPPSNQVRVSGHVEVTEVAIAPDVGGRVIELRLAEGDVVTAGAVVARLDARQTELQIDRARAERAVAEAELRLLQAGARPEEIRQARAQGDAVAAEVAAAEAEVSAAERDLERFERLLEARAGSVKQRDDARARVDVARERVSAARERRRAAQEVVAGLEAGARVQQLDAARARVAAIDAQIALLDETLADATVVSPVGGVVTETLVERGEMAAAGTPLLIVADLDHAWANLFVPEPVIPRLRIGQPAVVHTDAGGDGLAGTVSYVSPQAEFTPRNVQTQDERSRLVYRIKVTVDNRAGVLKPGMPVDAELTLP